VVETRLPEREGEKRKEGGGEQPVTIETCGECLQLRIRGRKKEKEGRRGGGSRCARVLMVRQNLEPGEKKGSKKGRRGRAVAARLWSAALPSVPPEGKKGRKREEEGGAFGPAACRRLLMAG